MSEYVTNKLDIILKDFMLIIYKIETSAFLHYTIDSMTPTCMCVCHLKRWNISMKTIYYNLTTCKRKSIQMYILSETINLHCYSIKNIVSMFRFLYFQASLLGK